jgi:threonine dehydrogenase-like Zn-dependent dehydrogenase
VLDAGAGPNGRRARLRRVPSPAPGPRDLLAAPLFAGLCGTDLQILRGVRPDSARVLGHEGIAVVLRGRADGAGPAAGSRIVFNPVNPRRQDEVLGHSFDGLFQQRRVVTDDEQGWGMAVPLEAGIPDLCATLVEPLGTAVYGQALVGGGRTPACVLVIGAGPVGLLNALHARARGCPRVLLASRGGGRLAWAVARGIVRTDDAVRLDDPAGEVRERMGGGACEVYVCVPREGAAAALRLAAACVREDGCIDLVGGVPAELRMAGVHPDPAEIRRRNVCGLPSAGAVFPARIGGRRARITGHRGTGPAHLAEAMAALRRRPWHYGRVISHVAPLGAAPALLARLARPGTAVDRDPFVKIVFDLQAEGDRAVPLAPPPAEPLPTLDPAD